MSNDPRFNTLHREFEWGELDQNFISLLNLIEASGTFPSIVAYDPTFQYQPGSAPAYVSHGGNIFENIAITPHTGITPGTNEAIWRHVFVSSLIHEQNTDFRLSNHSATIQAISGTVDLRTSAHRNKNEFVFSNPLGFGEYAINLQTTGIGTIAGFGHLFRVYIAPGENYNIRFSNTTDMYVGVSDVILTPGHIAYFLGSTISPGGAIRTHLLFLTGATAVSSNPFDQTLNKASSVDFQAVRVAGLAGATRAAVGVSITGQQERRSVVNLADVVLTGLKFRDAGNNNTIELRVVDNQILLIGVAGHVTT